MTDLKPSNILVERDGVVRLLDFGLAGRIERGAGPLAESALVGTLAYMSPEQCSGELTTPASDLYALGCMMFQLLTGQLPFAGNPSQLIHARLSRTPPRVQRRVAGVPEEIAGICHRLMARDPAERPSLREVRATLGRASSTRASSVIPGNRRKEQPFLGRRKELEELRSCLRRASEGSLQWVLLSGESGIGKSSLAAVLTSEATRLGFLGVSGRCYEREQVPFVAFDRAVDALIIQLSGWSAERRAPLHESLETLRPVFPAVGVLSPQRQKDCLPTGDEPGPRERYSRAAAGLCQLLESCQAQLPLLLVLDDLQWADEESIELLAALLSQCRGRMLILGLSRPEGLDAARPLHRLLPLAARAISLSALLPAEVVQLAEGVTGAGLDPQTAQMLLTRSAGNPFLTLQLAGYLASLTPAARREFLASHQQAGSWLSATTSVLSARAEHLLAIAATVGGDSSRHLLFLASGLPSSDFDLALGELMSARLLKALPVPTAAEEGTIERLDLYHDRIREAAYERLELARRRELHRALALTLEAQPFVSGPHFEALLRHWTGAGDRDKRRQYACKAAEQAEEKLAFRRAAQLLRSVLEDPEPDDAPLVTAARWERVGELGEYSGQLAEACEAYQRALTIWERLPRTDERRPRALLRLRGRVGENLMATGRIAQGREVYASGLRGMGLRFARPLLLQFLIILWLQLKLALTTLWPWRRSREATPLEREQIRFLTELARALNPLWGLSAMEAIARCEMLAHRFADRRLLDQITVNKIRVTVVLSRIGERKLARFHKLLDDVQELAQERNIPLGTENVQLTRALLYCGTDFARARRESEAAQAGFARHGMTDCYDSIVARLMYIPILWSVGDYDGALAAIEREQRATPPNFNNMITSLALKARILAQRGQFAEAEAEIVRTEELLASVPLCILKVFQKIMGAGVWAAKGEFARALAEAERTQSLMKDIGVAGIGLIRAYLQEVLLEAALGLARQGGLSSRQRARAGKWARALAQHGVMDFQCMGYRALALFAHREGRPEAAQRELARALAHSRTSTNPYRRWLCLLAAQELQLASPELVHEAAAHAEQHRFFRSGGGWGAKASLLAPQ